MPSNNLVYIAAAGSGKTTHLVEEALKNANKKIAIITYTINNLNEIRNCIYLKLSYIPSNIIIQSWFSFLLTECVRPYQNFQYDEHRIESIEFYHGRSARFIAKSDIKYFLSEGKYIYTDKISEFACLCDRLSKGLIINRLEEIYDAVYIDEIQDLAGYDFDFLELLLESKLETIFVGDNRQATFSTNNSIKYKKFKGKNIIDLFKLWEKQGKCFLNYMQNCYRCNQMICDLADSLYPEMPKTISCNKDRTGHDGNFIIKEKDVNKYLFIFKPVVLRYDIKTKYDDIIATNFGVSKGLTFDRVLIIPNGPINKFLNTGELYYIEKSKPKLYVAITRAKYSVAFIYDGICALKNTLDFNVI